MYLSTIDYNLVMLIAFKNLLKEKIKLLNIIIEQKKNVEKAYNKEFGKVL